MCLAVSRKNKRAAQQFNGREGETATLLLNLSVTFDVDAGGFAPRQLRRSVLHSLFFEVNSHE